MDFFISDTHFNHKRILEFERYNFKTIEEHNDSILKLIESTVSKNDTLYHLGDVGYYSQDVGERLSKLPCHKIIIMGNHDNNPSSKLLLNCFDEVYKYPIFYMKRVLLSHEPLPVTNGTLNIHGHIHNGKLSFINYINCNIHNLQYKKLLTSKIIKKELMKLPKDNWKYTFEWYKDNEIKENYLKKM